MNLSLRQLRGFLLVARLGSFTRAAEQLHITQAGLSAMMRDLEQQFDCRLFDRTTRFVALTREGASLLPHADAAVEQIDKARAVLSASTLAARRILAIAVTPIFAAALAPAIIRAFVTSHPDVDVRVNDVPRGEIQGLVERGEADAGFGIFLKQAAGIELEPLLKFQLAYIAPAGTLSPAAPGRASDAMRSIAWSRIPQLPLVALAKETPVQQVVDRCLVETGVVRDVPQVCNNMHTMLSMVEAGGGATILPSMVVPLCPSATFDVARLTAPSAELQFYRIGMKGRQSSPAVAPFVRTMVDVVSQACRRQR